MYEDIKKRFAELEEKLADPAISQDLEKLKTVAKEHAQYREVHDLITQQAKISEQIEESQEIIKTESDQEILAMAKEELSDLQKQSDKLIAKIEEEVNPDDPNDKRNTIMEIRAGAGGEESNLFAADLFRMYSKFCELKGWKTEILNSNTTGLGGYKEVIFSIEGQKVYGSLKYEAGTHRVQRIPETEKQGRIHTSAATVAVLPEAEEIEVDIKAADIRIDTFCSSGPGGQSVNTTHSAIRITHLPTGMIVSCQDQKSQHQNKDKALQVLRSRLLSKMEEERRDEQSSTRKQQIGSGDRSDKVRTYNFPQDRVTDHRIKKSWHNIVKIMEGELDPVIEALKQAQKDLNKKNDS